jgi:hypothetical protein
MQIGAPPSDRVNGFRHVHDRRFLSADHPVLRAWQVGYTVTFSIELERVMKAILLSAVAALAFAAGGSAEAATPPVFDLQVEGGGTPIVFQLGNGNLLGALGFDTRSGITTGGTVTTGDITAGFTSGGGNIVDYYFGRDAAFNTANGADELDLISGPIDIADNSRFFQSIFVEWTGGNLVYNFTGKTRTLSGTVTQAGDPLAPSPVPLPAAMWLLLAGMGGLAYAGRAKGAAAAPA